MILRRVIDHVKSQNWTAVALDFVIVVMGVFIGIQVANWNEAKSNKAGLVASLERLDNEVSRNIAIIDHVLSNFEKGRKDLNLGRDALNNCAYTPEGQAALERSLFQFTEDVLPNFVTVALDQIANQVRYQDLLTTGFQQDFEFYASRLKEEHEQLTSHYERMSSHHVNFHPGVDAFFGRDSDQYKDWGFRLDRPFEEICSDAPFRNRYINTLGFYLSIESRLRRLKTEVETFQKALAVELERQS